MRIAPRIGSLMLTIRASKRNSLLGGKIEWRWHLAHREWTSAGVCAGCDQRIRADEALDLIDGARVHLKDGSCRIAYEQRWRSAATNALIVLGLQPPATDKEVS
jgi:hypothetical protein